MAIVHIATFTAADRAEAAKALCAKIGAPGAEPAKAANGKPFLKSSGKMLGLAVTHLRLASPPLSLMAVSDCPGLGIDAELWPARGDDMAFLTTVSSPEDYPLVQRLHRQGRDGGRFLWVAKEAALKASGDVMTDPSHVKLQAEGNRLVATASRLATAPFADVRLALFATAPAPGRDPFLLAVALSGQDPSDRAFDVIFDNALGNLQPIAISSI